MCVLSSKSSGCTAVQGRTRRRGVSYCVLIGMGVLMGLGRCGLVRTHWTVVGQGGVRAAAPALQGIPVIRTREREI